MFTVYLDTNIGLIRTLGAQRQYVWKSMFANPLKQRIFQEADLSYNVHSTKSADEPNYYCVTMCCYKCLTELILGGNFRIVKLL